MLAVIALGQHAGDGTPSGRGLCGRSVTASGQESRRFDARRVTAASEEFLDARRERVEGQEFLIVWTAEDGLDLGQERIIVGDGSVNGDRHRRGDRRAAQAEEMVIASGLGALAPGFVSRTPRRRRRQ